MNGTYTPMRSALIPLLALALASCMGSNDVQVPPDETFGHRVEEEGPAGRRTIDVTPPESDQRYFYYPAVLDTVHVRPAPFDSDHAVDDQVPVDVLVKGSLPDACTELHDATQERFGHIIEVKLQTRRPQGAVCATVIRPFRFYMKLQGLYGPGSYTLKLNDKIIPFSVRERQTG